MQSNKRKIINDPLYGFITLPFDVIYDIIEHPYFQRLRRIRQLGLTSMVYPGAYNTRFHHAIGAMHLAMEAVDVLREKGHAISEEEREGLAIAILLHDIGHGPFSHALEHSIVTGINHEELSLLFMRRLNEELEGALDLAIRIFRNEYPKHFLHQLISSQLDVDRLDYLNRDSFYTGVQEGVIGVDRIIKLLNVNEGDLVVDQKGIYSIEKFLVARRIMYWQVYLHKTVISAEFLLMNVLTKAKSVVQSGRSLFASPPLAEFLEHNFDMTSFEEDTGLLSRFAQLDDYDILGAIKVWRHDSDPALSQLCSWVLDRNLYKIEVAPEPFDADRLAELKRLYLPKLEVEESDLPYFVFTGHLDNIAYNPQKGINILFKDGSLKDIGEASDHLNITSLSTPVRKYFVCYPKRIKI